MEFYILASGSKGNCSVIKTKETLIIIDCGMSWRYLENAFNQYNINYKQADALLITHLHSDHSSSLGKFPKLTKYVTFDLEESNKIDFYQTFTIKDLTITPLPLSHDSPNTTGYLFQDKKEKLVYITDTGYLSKNNLSYLKNADYYIMESNHDPVMLLNTRRPTMLKRRILTDDGHLSNLASAIYLKDLIGDKTKEIVLAHLSLEANRPELAHRTLCEVLSENKIDHKKIRITTAGQDCACLGGKI